MFFHKHILKFSCLGEDCPDDCCTGWRVPLSDIDQSTLKKHLGTSKYQDAVENKLNQQCLKQSQNACTFLKPSGLCDLQQKHGHEALPTTCSSYPRVWVRNGTTERVGGLLSCPEISRLTLTLDASTELKEAVVPQRMNLITSLDLERPYESMMPMVNEKVLTLLSTGTLDEAVGKIASIAALSPAFFNQNSDENGWATCVRKSLKLNESNDHIPVLKIWELVQSQAVKWSSQLYQFPISRENLINVIHETGSDSPLALIQEWHKEWGGWEACMKRYWAHYWSVYPYTLYPDLALYTIRLALSSALVQWVSAVNGVSSPTEFGKSLYTVERLIDHSAWKAKGTLEFQRLTISSRSVIMGLMGVRN
jgi:hypothetical protein